MSCPTELELSMHADGALEADDAERIAAHAGACEPCQAALCALRSEMAVLSSALAVDDERTHVPAFARPLSMASIAIAATLVLAAAVCLTAAPALLGMAPPFAWLGAAPPWLDPFDSHGLADAAVRSTLFLARNGGAIMSSITQAAAAAVVVAFAVWIAAALGRRRAAALTLAAVAAGGLLSPSPADALEIRESENGVLRVEAGETIDDTLIALAGTIEIDGNVEGDLIALGRVVVVRGRVGGQLLTLAQSVNISGDVAGSVIGLGETVNVSSGQIGRNLYGFANTLNASQSARIGQNAIVYGQFANLAGPVDRDVLAFGERLEIGNTIGGGLTARSRYITLLSPARVAGDFTAHVRTESDISISPDATIAGERAIEIREDRADENEYLTSGFYVTQLLRFAAAFVAGLIVLALVPGLRRAAPTSPVNGLAACGIGLVTLVSVPIIAVLAVITVVGIPIAVLGLMLYVVGVYLAKVVLAHFIGRRLIETRGSARHFAAALALGLVLVIVAVNLPFVGGWLNFLLTIAGLGLIVRLLWTQARGMAA